MSDYMRTRIRRLFARGYRSLREIEQGDLPDLVVLHGPNGSGKSNLLRATQLALRVVANQDELPGKREEAVPLTLNDASSLLDLRLEDFTWGGDRQIRIGVEIELGERARALLGGEFAAALQCLFIDVVFQDVGDGKILFWCDRADVDGTLRLSKEEDPKVRAVRKTLAQLKQQRAQQQVQLTSYRDQISQQPAQVRPQLTASYGPAIQQVTATIAELNKHVREKELELGDQALLSDRIRLVLCRELLQLHEAYRVPGGKGNPEGELQRALLSSDPRDLDAVDRLRERLARVHVFGSPTGPVDLRPVEGPSGERQVYFLRPPHGWLPLRNLGTGEQQVIIMLAQGVITRRPIAHMEEPEAHLHSKLMEPVADFLRESVFPDRGRPDVDQLWIATHHHMFAIAPTYFDVRLDENGATQIERTSRAEAGKHFYEPGPFWDALRDLVASGIDENSIVSRDAQGQPIHAKDVLASIEGDRELANAFVHDATRSVLLSLQKRESNK
jgi:energy-coupling factor transporter ATP-binding protein EcfA2